MGRPHQSGGNLTQEQLDQIIAKMRSGQFYEDTRRSNAKRYARVAGKFLKVAGLAALGCATAVLPGGQAAAGQAFSGIIQELAQMVDDPPWSE